VTQLIWQSATTLARLIAAQEVSSADVVAAHIDRIEVVNPRLNAVVVPLYDQARQEAKRADQRVASGEPLGPLHGVPITVKECYHLAGTASSIGVSQFQSEVFDTDGPLIQRLRSAGAIILGKTNVPQAMLLHETDNPIYGRTNNPWDLNRSPGGSSGGEAAIIAAGGSPLGIANDLGGSIRQPAHVCGLAGIKPTTGRFSNTGCRNNLSGLRLIATLTGAIARTTEDLQLALRVLQPSRDVPRCHDEMEMPWQDPAAVNVAALRVGYFEDDGYFTPSPAVRRAVREAVDVLRNLGAQVVEFQPPDVSAAMSLYFSLLGADGARAISQFLEGDKIDWRIAKLVKIGRVEHPWREIIASAAAAAKQPRTAQLLR
jgi:fatty acid amide hydrolase